ncbi:hypothetical protein INT44_002103 [Umbelopsis vinacea]|uniref:SWIB-domain-containing protein n=1 Tax=Umbelopsis vinacea TaxID=44442 RepID=A0A8H7Q3P1_9FUNG|nr:hypothetical protein INT44_002103 [Umbelopsis vinacea]
MVQELKPAIRDILKDSDMATVSAKSVRKKLETINGCSYNDKKKEIDALIIEIYEAMQADEEDSSDDQPLVRQKSESTKPRDKKEEYDAYVMKPSPSKRKAASSKSKTDDAAKPAKKKKTRTPSATGRGAPNNGFMKPLRLSPAIQTLTRCEQDELPRPTIVKRIWEYIKEKDLQDPSDKRSILCDDTMKAVFKIDRVHMFTMNKILNEELKAVADDQAAGAS